MKWIVSMILSSAACGLGFLGLFADPQIVGRTPSSPPCLNEATIQLTATPSNIQLGESSVVSWSVEGCSSVWVRLNGVTVATSGSRSFCLGQNTEFKLLVTEMGGGQKSESTQVEVTYPTHVVIDQNTCDPAGVLVGALAYSTNEEQTVELSCGVVIDMTGRSIDITRDHRSLIASPNCARGPRTRNDDVPRIFVKDKEPRSGALSALFSIRGDHIVFSGFRLQGPTPGIGTDNYLENAILVSPGDCKQPRPVTEENKFACAIHNIELSNMEIFHWSGAGIGVSDNVNNQERGRLFNTFFVDPVNKNIVGAVHIKGNYFHDNRHDHGFGYGVVVGGGAYALIEQNVFNNNRHAIAGDSKNPGGPPGSPESPDYLKGLDYSGYTARDNLIGPNGGSHCNPSTCDWVIGVSGIASVVFPVLGIPGILGGVACHAADLECYHTHQIDMHGDKNEWYSSSNWECGTAGETIIIERNTILYTGGSTLVDVVRDGWDFLLGVVGALPGTPGPHFSGSFGHAIKIRGDPADKAVVDSNVFKHGNSKEAIAQNDNCRGKKTHPIKEVNNIFGRDPLGELASYISGRDPSLKELASCDFSGFRNGQQDQFMVTGVTWWALSPVSTQFHYLNTMAEPADDLAKGQQLSDLKLGDFDGDGVCDVAPKTAQRFPRRLYSKSGRSPWMPLPLDTP
jgi:hypothetical protein